MKDIKILNSKERSVLTALGVSLYADKGLMLKLLKPPLLFQIKWKAGSKESYFKGMNPHYHGIGWNLNKYMLVYVEAYIRKSGIWYGNEKLEGEGFRWE